MGVEAEGGILERDGPACLSRSEYQITYRELESTSYSSQTQKENMSPLFFDSPDSTASQDGSVISAKPYTPYHGIKSSSGKRFKCEYQGCAYAASRRDHVRAHFKAHHDGNPFVCSKWYAHTSGLLILLFTGIFQQDDVCLSGGSPITRLQ